MSMENQSETPNCSGTKISLSDVRGKRAIFFLSRRTHCHKYRNIIIIALPGSSADWLMTQESPIWAGFPSKCFKLSHKAWSNQIWPRWNLHFYKFWVPRWYQQMINTRKDFLFQLPGDSVKYPTQHCLEKKAFVHLPPHHLWSYKWQLKREIFHINWIYKTNGIKWYKGMTADSQGF